MAQQIQLRRDTSSNWTSVNPTLAQGEIGIETNTYKMKVGDGVTAWNSLSYFGVPATTTISTTAPLTGGGDLSANRTFAITQSNTSTDGYLSSTDWNTFNNKLTPNTPITGATKTKITYDADGLVTAGADATTADIADSLNKRYITDAQQTLLGNTSGTNTGDETKTSIETKLGASSSSNNGYLSSTDWSTFNNKQNALGYTPANASTTISTSSPLTGGGDLSANRTLSITQSNTTTSGYLSSTDWNTFNGKLTPNSPITGATKTKITYDANGLVTAGADATTADISDSTNKRYVTDADLTKLSNTSGTNTGDVTVTDSSTIDFTLTGQALTGSVIEGGITHNNLGSLQGGTSGQYNHLTNAELTALQGISTTYLKTDLSNTPLTGINLNFNAGGSKFISVDRTTVAGTTGKSLTIQAGGAYQTGTNLLGGNLELKSGIATGNQGSDITFFTARGIGSGTTDRTPSQKMVIKGSGNVGIGVTNPTDALEVSGNVIATNISGINTGDNINPIYGDGADGYVSFDGFTLHPTFCTFDGTSLYTLTRDVYGTTIEVSSGQIVDTAGYRIFANSNIVCNGTIRNNGGNASGTTGGTGATGNFFKAGGNGANGLGTGTAGSAGTAQTQTTPVSTAWVGGLGGRGGPGRSTVTSFNGGYISTTNAAVPPNNEGGSRVTSNINNYLNKFVSAGTPWQMFPAYGGGSGAKSTTGTTAASGAGGGGGGVVFVASPLITGTGGIYAIGGDGSNATGTGGSFGGGGGGGGGVLCVVAKDPYTVGPSLNVNGGAGGTSVTGSNGNLCVLLANGTATTTSTTVSYLPTSPLTKEKLVIIAFHIQKTGGVSNCYVTNITGYGYTWTQYSGSRLEFDTIATPTRAIEVWYGTPNTEPDIIDDEYIRVTYSEAPTNSRFTIDEIANADLGSISGDLATNSTNSALNLTVTLGSAPATGTTVYSVFAKSNANAATVGAGNTAVNNQSTGTPSMITEVSVAQQANSVSHLTNNAAIGGVSIVVNQQPTNAQSGSTGWSGRLIRLYG
jgi:hypothetical protein